MTPAQEIARGQRAKLILEDPLFKECVEIVQKAIFDDFAETPPSKPDDMVLCRLRLKTLAEFTRQFANVMYTGKLAEWREEEERGFAKRAAARLRAGIRGVF